MINVDEKLLELIRRINELPVNTLPPAERGIYFLMLRGKLQYIGITEIGIKRIMQHMDKEFDSYRFLPLPDYSKKELEALEVTLIVLSNPNYNKQNLLRGLEVFKNAIKRLGQ